MPPTKRKNAQRQVYPYSQATGKRRANDTCNSSVSQRPRLEHPWTVVSRSTDENSRTDQTVDSTLTDHMEFESSDSPLDNAREYGRQTALANFQIKDTLILNEAANLTKYMSAKLEEIKGMRDRLQTLEDEVKATQERLTFLQSSLLVVRQQIIRLGGKTTTMIFGAWGWVSGQSSADASGQQ